MKMLNVTPKIDINYQEFRWRIREHGTRKVVKELERLWYLTKDAVDFGWDNTGIRISNIYGQMFAVIFDEHEDYINMTIWNENGSASLGTFELLENEFAPGELKRFKNTMNDWTCGYMPCSKCGKRIKYLENTGHRYFAGVYCIDCWESEMKAIEANESYN